jgi:translation initiation factor IF-2
LQTELTQYEILTEDLGGDVLVEEISAKTQAGIPQLLEKVRMQADLMDLKANPSRDAVGVVVEAKLEKGLGTVATVLVQKGTLKVGDAFIAGEASGKVRALLGDDGKTRFDSAAPSMPIKVVGFTGVPAAGDLFIVAEDEQLAKELADNRQRLAREASSTSYQSALMSNVADLIANGLEGRKVEKEMSVIIKADVQGSAEALARALSELTLEDDESQVVVKVLLSEVGDVTKNDVSVASVRDETSVIAFNVAANMAAMDEARTAGVDIQYFNIIYDAIESVESRMQEVLSPTPEGEYAGKAIVQEVFNIGGTGNIAGSKCLDGKIRKGGNVRVMRGDKILIESKVKTLRHLKGTVEVIDEGMECGIGLDIFEDYEVGDVIECYVEI